MNKKFKLKKGDEVIVLAGKDKGKTGKIIKIVPKQMKVIVSEINKVKKNQKPDNNQPGGIIDKEMPIHISNLSFYDPELKKGIRIGYKLDKNKKVLQSQADCIDGLKDALDVTIALTAHYLEKHVFEYCVTTNTISELNSYITNASQRESDILIKKMHNLFDATPKNKSVLKQMPLKKLLDNAKMRLLDSEAYKYNDRKTANYDFMVNMLKMERTLAKADHPFIVLSLNAEN